jgi:hypothetical protein
MTRVECYQKIVMNLISLLEVDGEDCWFQQDGGYSAYSKFKSVDV